MVNPLRKLIIPLAGLLVLVSSGCGESAPQEAPSGGQEVSEVQARALYIRKCSLCHGDNGKLMASKSPDLSLSDLTLEERMALITYGKGTMPGQKDVLNKAEIRAVAQYIERFRD
ncbi:MAG: cytochrome c [Flavobacteriales bacterium]|nr:cytochrome c [Flavobacteriales bacterium]